MTRDRAIQIIMELAEENRISEREQEPDLVSIREEQDEAFSLIYREPLR